MWWWINGSVGGGIRGQNGEAQMISKRWIESVAGENVATFIKLMARLIHYPSWFCKYIIPLQTTRTYTQHIHCNNWFIRAWHDFLKKIKTLNNLKCFFFSHNTDKLKFIVAKSANLHQTFHQFFNTSIQNI